jgi:hypothetical protein
LSFQHDIPYTMAEPDEQEARAKTFLRDWLVRKAQYENHWPSIIAKECKHVENNLAVAFDAALAEQKQSMAAVHTAISTAEDEHEANRLCGDLLDESGMAEKLLQALSDRIRAKYGVEDRSAVSGDVAVAVPDVELVSTSSDTDDSDGNDDGGSDDGSAYAPNGATTRDTTRASSRRTLASCR